MSDKNYKNNPPCTFSRYVRDYFPTLPSPSFIRFANTSTNEANKESDSIVTAKNGELVEPLTKWRYW